MDENRLAQIAVELVTRVRDDDPISNGRWLQAVTSDDDRWALLFVLAAAVPCDVPWTHLTAWAWAINDVTVPSIEYRKLVAERFAS